MFGRWLGIEETMRVGSHDGISALKRRGRDIRASPCPRRTQRAMYKPEEEFSLGTESAVFKS